MLSVHVGDVKGTAPKEVADSLLRHLNDSVGRCKADYGAFFHIGIQHEHKFCAVALTVLTRVEVAVYVQALQRRAHAARVTDCSRLNVVMRCMQKHKCGLKSVSLRHPLKLVGFTDVASKVQPDEPIGLALRGGLRRYRKIHLVMTSPTAAVDWQTSLILLLGGNAALCEVHPVPSYMAR